MVENFIEEIVTEWYRLRGFVVMKNVWFGLEKGRGRGHPGQSDMDVMAVTGSEVHFVSCVSQTPAWSPVGDWLRGTTVHFAEARGRLPELFPILGQYDTKSFHNVLVAEYVSKPLRGKLKEIGITTYSLKEVIVDFVQQVQQRWEEGVKLENPVARTIAFLFEQRLLRLDSE